MSRARRAVVLLLALLAAACTDAQPAPEPSAAVTATASGEAGALFSDGFDDDAGGWRDAGTGDAVIGDGVYTWILPPGDQVLVALPGALRDRGDALASTRVRVAVTVSAAGARVGIACRARGAGARDGLYVLSTRLPEVDAHRITRLDRTGRVELAQAQPAPQEVPDLERTHVLEADCVERRGRVELALHVDGDRVLEARDPRPLRTGSAGLWAASPPSDIAAEPTTIEFDDFVVERG